MARQQCLQGPECNLLNCQPTRAMCRELGGQKNQEKCGGLGIFGPRGFELGLVG